MLGAWPKMSQVDISQSVAYPRPMATPTATAVTGHFGGDPFRRQFFAESSMKFWTFRQFFLPVSAK